MIFGCFWSVVCYKGQLKFFTFDANYELGGASRPQLLTNINGYLSLVSTWTEPHTWHTRILQLVFSVTDNPAQVFFAPEIIRFRLFPSTWTLIGCISVRSVSQSDRLMDWLCRWQQVVAFVVNVCSCLLLYQFKQVSPKFYSTKSAGIIFVAFVQTYFTL